MHRGFFCLRRFCQLCQYRHYYGRHGYGVIFVAVIISLLGIIRLPLLIMMPFILAVLGMNLH